MFDSKNKSLGNFRDGIILDADSKAKDKQTFNLLRPLRWFRGSRIRSIFGQQLQAGKFRFADNEVRHFKLFMICLSDGRSSLREKSVMKHEDDVREVSFFETEHFIHEFLEFTMAAGWWKAFDNRFTSRQINWKLTENSPKLRKKIQKNNKVWDWWNPLGKTKYLKNEDFDKFKMIFCAFFVLLNLNWT